MSSELEPVYTEKTKCRDCYKCVRNCPVKAIKVEDNSARIIHELCIFCGRCVYVCPNKAKKVRSDVDKVKALIRSGKRVLLSLAPSWTTGLFGSEQEMLEKLHSLGFCGISETALGAEMVSGNTVNELSLRRGLTVSSACPSVVELFKKYYSHRLPLLSKQPSPLQAHALFLKKYYGEDTKVVFAGPCIAKKLEADEAGSSVDYSLTFDELLLWLEEMDEPVKAERGPLALIPWRASEGTLYAMEGGMIASMDRQNKGGHTVMVPLSGVKYIMESLEEVREEEDMLLELLSCPGGCVNGSGFQSCGNQFSYRKKSLDHYHRSLEEDRSPEDLIFPMPLRDYKPCPVKTQELYSEIEIRKALQELGKEEEDDILDCGGCGYNSCREFALACLSGMGEKQMCVTNMRKQAQKKVDMLLRTLPMGVVIVNRERNIVECNSQFTALFSPEDYLCDDEYVRNHFDLPLSNFIDLSASLDLIFEQEKSVLQEKIKNEGKFLKLSFFSIERGQLAGVIIQDITSTSVKREDVIKKAEEVISKNLQNVQQIASLLGENAAETEIILRSLTDQFHFVSSGDNL